MASVLRNSLLRLLPVAILLLLSACSSVSKGPAGKVVKVKHFHLVPGERLVTADRSILFERQHLLHGAVSASEQRERAGHYYSFQWSVDDRSQPVTLRLQYRQANTGLDVQTLTQEVAEVRRSNWSKFQITGPAYHQNGRVTAWKLTLERGGEVLASQQSYLWE
jgi:hypothetical protein